MTEVVKLEQSTSQLLRTQFNTLRLFYLFNLKETTKMTIKFDIKDNKTGKTSTYSKDIITMGEAEKFYEFLDKTQKESAKDEPDAKKVRELERQYLVSLFADQGLTEEEVLNNMGTRQYTKALGDVFREIQGDDDEDTENEKEEVGKTEN